MACSQVSFGSIRGSVVNKDGEPMPFVRVFLYASGADHFLAGVQTDFDGVFHLKNVAPGMYTLEMRDEVSSVEPSKLKEVRVLADQVTVLGSIEMSYAEIIGCDFGFPHWEKEFLMEPLNGNSTTIKKEDIRRP